MNKGISVILAEIMLVTISVGLMSMFYVFYDSSSKQAMENAEEQGDDLACIRNSNLVIEEISERNLTLKNLGSTNLNASHISVYLDNAPLEAIVPEGTLKPGDRILVVLSVAPPVGSRMKISGDCNTGDEVYVR
ncbi:MAG: hypothetical protein JW727_02090 [Candidatus Aenigmarchaeota archaeon]|nr:hypothetical protein [Candidatus Aenigmarchaeota archaeon]